MKYLLLIHVNEKELATWTPEQVAKGLQGCDTLTAEMKAAGVYLGGERLRPTETSTVVRVHGGRTTLTDGPFIETKEQLGGFYMINVTNHDEAVGWAKRMPHTAFATIEVRPVWE